MRAVPANAKAHYNWGNWLKDQGDHDAAGRHYREAIRYGMMHIFIAVHFFQLRYPIRPQLVGGPFYIFHCKDTKVHRADIKETSKPVCVAGVQSRNERTNEGANKYRDAKG